MTSDPGAREDVELLPCPFCGSEALERGDPNARLARWVNCKGCNADMVGKTLDEAIAKWNRRTSLSEAEERGRRKGLEEAASFCDEFAKCLSADSEQYRREGRMSDVYRTNTAWHNVVSILAHIRALATSDTGGER